MTQTEENTAFNSIAKSGLFDSDYYLSNYRDVYDSGMDPVIHYVRHGSQELRKPNKSFNALLYNIFYQCNEGNSLVHYINNGINIDTSIPIIYTTNDKYVPNLSVSIISLIKNTNSLYSYTIYVLHVGISQENIDALLSLSCRSNVQIKCINIYKLVSDKIIFLHPKDHVSIEARFKFFLADMFFLNNKLVYLDGDTIVNHDIADLYNIECSNCALVAAPDFDKSIALRHKKYVSDKSKALSIPLDATKYFNSGILLINADYFRKHHLADKCFNMIRSYHDFSWVDQDTLNFCCAGQTKLIDKSWNIQWHSYLDGTVNGHQEYERLLIDPYIIHYTYRKPWNYDTDHKLKEYFWKYAEGTPFYEKLQSALQK